jgi:hypothetical protein
MRLSIFYRNLMLSFCAVLFLALTQEVHAQYPPRPVVVTATGQGLAFGAFYQGASGGTVTVTPEGSRSASGSVVLLFAGYPYSPALFTIRGNPGTLITIMAGPDVILPGSNGGSLTLQIGPTIPLSPFVLTAPFPEPTDFLVGGTLIVGSPAANPPGAYSGTFTIIFNQQ